MTGPGRPLGSARMPAVRRPTINDVAALSGVSKSTVSNVMRGTGSVSAATHARVLESIKTLGYRPNAAARNLVQQRTNLIGVVVGDLANAFNAELVKRMEQHASAHRYTTLVCNTGGHPEREAARIEALLEQRVDGIALLEFTGDRAVLSQLLAERVPVVMVSCWADYADCVAVDDYAGISLAIDHLTELGHGRIGHAIDGLMEPTTRRTRMDAFERALLRRGLEVAPEWSITWDDAVEPRSGERAVRALFDGPEAPTAMVAANDFTAIRLMELAEGHGLGVPSDLSVVGFDGIAIGALSRIALTTVAQPREELASLSVQILLERMQQGPDAPSQQHRLQPSLIVRGSTAPPAAGR
jgi:DNA-binding LacI/PurR family transcriptional regulator